MNNKVSNVSKSLHFRVIKLRLVWLLSVNKAEIVHFKI